MPEWIVHGTFSFAVLANDEEQAIDYACDKIGNGWEWRATQTAESQALGENCPACGNPIDYCPGHGVMGDPTGWATLNAHDNDDHVWCHEAAPCRQPVDGVTELSPWEKAEHEAGRHHNCAPAQCSERTAPAPR